MTAKTPCIPEGSKEGGQPVVRLVWKMLHTGELIDGAVPFVPPSRAVYAMQWREKWFELCQ